MSFSSRTAGTHNHLARKVKKHLSLNKADAGAQDSNGSDAAKKDQPFGRLQFGSTEGEAPAAYKPIFRI